MSVSEQKPTVLIYESGVEPMHLAEVCAGLEEEGIPYSITRASGDAKLLAAEAANHSRLRVGIGITRDIAILQIRNYTMDIPVSNEAAPALHIKLNDPAAKHRCRALGTNAARLVKGSMLI